MKQLINSIKNTPIEVVNFIGGSVTIIAIFTTLYLIIKIFGYKFG